MTTAQRKAIEEKLRESQAGRQVRTYNEAGELIKDWHTER